MRLKDSDLADCQLERVMSSSIFTNIGKCETLKECMDARRYYCIAVTFVMGLHPAGRFATWKGYVTVEDRLYSLSFRCTESNIMMSIQDPSSALACKSITAADFISMYIASNVFNKNDDKIIISNHSS